METLVQQPFWPNPNPGFRSSLLAVLPSLYGTMDSVSMKRKYATSLCKTFNFLKSSSNPDLMEIGFLNEIVGLRYVFSTHIAGLSWKSLNKNVLTPLPNRAFCSQLQIKSTSNLNLTSYFLFSRLRTRKLLSNF